MSDGPLTLNCREGHWVFRPNGHLKATSGHFALKNVFTPIRKQFNNVLRDNIKTRYKLQPPFGVIEWKRETGGIPHNPFVCVLYGRNQSYGFESTHRHDRIWIFNRPHPHPSVFPNHFQPHPSRVPAVASLLENLSASPALPDIQILNLHQLSGHISGRVEQHLFTDQ